MVGVVEGTHRGCIAGSALGKEGRVSLVVKEECVGVPPLDLKSRRKLEDSERIPFEKAILRIGRRYGELYESTEKEKKMASVVYAGVEQSPMW